MTSRNVPDVLHTGVIGCADIAWRRTMPALQREPLIELVAVASRDGAKARRFAERFECAAADSYQALLDRDDVDAVYLPVPTGLHAEWIGRALRAGKHVLAEKPLTTDATETAELLALAQRQQLVLMENFMFTQHSQHDAVRKLVQDGAIGELREFSSVFTIPRLPSGDIRHRPALGGGCLLDVGGYPIRASQLFLGQNLTVTGAILRYDPETQVDVAGSVLLRSGSGVPAQLTFGMDHAYRSRYELSGSKGRLLLDRAFTPPADHVPVIRWERAGGVEEIRLPPDDQFGNMVRAFARTALSDATIRRQDSAVRTQAALVDEIRRLAGSVHDGQNVERYTALW